MKEKAFPITTGQTQSRAVSPILIGMLIVVVIFPFIADKLPAVLQSYLNAIHK